MDVGNKKKQEKIEGEKKIGGKIKVRRAIR